MPNEYLIDAAIKAEEALAGLAFVQPSALLEVDIDASYFSDPLLAKLIDLAKTSSDGMRNTSSAIKIGLAPARIAKLASSACLAGSVRDYSLDLVRVRQAQNLERMAQRIYDEIQSDPNIDPKSLIGWIEGEILKIRTGELEPPLVDLSEVVEEVVESHRQRMETGETDAISTGYRCIDKATGGMFAGQLWQIAARSYMGKTALALDMAAKMACVANVLFVSLEMSRQELTDRLLANLSHVPLERFTKGTLTQFDIERAQASSERIKRLPIKFTTAYTETVQSIRAKARLMRQQVGLGVVVIDNLQLLKSTDMRPQRHERIQQNTKDLKVIARELGVRILLLSQLNADADGQEPTDKNYAGSKETIADIDVSILLHRESKDHPDMQLICTKNRRGGLPFRAKLNFDGEFQRFAEPQNEFEEWSG